MKKEIYQSYTEDIKELLVKGDKRNSIEKSSTDNILSGNDDNLLLENKNISLFNSLSQLSNISGKKVKYSERPGAHPDFIHLKNSNRYINHYITSVFIDIKNSTSLFKKYDPLTVSKITSAIQMAAIHTCWHFDGYVQRFHGDGLLVYFGGKNSTKELSVTNAINATSFFSYFIKYDLDNILQDLNIDQLFTRIGIDLGYDKDVVWYSAGVKECSEITTCSLHTSLAAKMQIEADNNGIMIGDNVKNTLLLENSELFSIKYNEKESRHERYIFQIPSENFNYTQWQFNWEGYLENLQSLEKDEAGKLYIKPSLEYMNNNDSKNYTFLKENVQDYKPYFKG